MNNSELQAARKLLMLDVAEAAEHVGKASTRAWQYWESGRNAVPGDVSEQMIALLRMRRDMVEEIREQAGGERVTLRYFGSLAEFRDAHPDGNVVGWRLYQSAVAHFYAAGAADLTPRLRK